MTGMKDARLTPLGDERAQIEALIACLTAAVGHDLELDAEIGYALGIETKMDHITASYEHENYTASIDAALTLVPEGCALSLEMWPGHPTRITLRTCHQEDGEWWYGGTSCGDRRIDAAAPTAPLAISIAALKAHLLAEPLAPQGAQPTHTKGDQ